MRGDFLVEPPRLNIRAGETAPGFGTKTNAKPQKLAPSSTRLESRNVLELRPTCENCNVALPPDSVLAMICTFECTFCCGCVASVLANVCPNCGGGFSPRPIRPAKSLRGENYLGKYPASGQITHRPVDIDAHVEFSERIKHIPPELR